MATRESAMQAYIELLDSVGYSAVKVKGPGGLLESLNLSNEGQLSRLFRKRLFTPGEGDCEAWAVSLENLEAQNLATPNELKKIGSQFKLVKTLRLMDLELIGRFLSQIHAIFTDVENEDLANCVKRLAHGYHEFWNTPGAYPLLIDGPKDQVLYNKFIKFKEFKSFTLLARLYQKHRLDLRLGSEITDLDIGSVTYSEFGAVSKRLDDPELLNTDRERQIASTIRVESVLSKLILGPVLASKLWSQLTYTVDEFDADRYADLLLNGIQAG